MRKNIQIVGALVLSAIALFAFPIRTRAGKDLSSRFSQRAMMQVTANPQLALAKCMDVTHHLRIRIAEMARIGHPWSRSRLTYDANDLSTLVQHSAQLHRDVDDLAAAHQQFLNDLSADQRSRLTKPLGKLDRLLSELPSRISQLDHDLMRAKPGPNTPSLSWDIRGIREAADKWASQEKEIAKEMYRWAPQSRHGKGRAQ